MLTQAWNLQGPECPGRPGAEAAHPDGLRAYRSALGLFPTGIAVCTTVHRHAPAGLTVNSFTSLSLTPRLVSWAIGRRSAAFDAFLAGHRQVISVLASSHANMARRFAGPAAERFEGLELPLDPDGVPWIPGAVAVFGCRTTGRVDVGDHVLLIAEVDRYLLNPGAPLVFAAGEFATLGPAP